MITGKYVSANVILQKLYLDHKFITNELNESDAIEWMADAILLLGVPQAYIKKSCNKTVEDYKTEIPAELIRFENIFLIKGGKKIALRYNGDHSFVKMHCDDSINISCKCEDTYTLNNNYIFTSFEEGTLEINYHSFPVDDKGYPMIPEDQAFIEAITLYIAYKVANNLWMADRLKDNQFKHIKTEKDWYMGKAIARGKMLSIDQMESFKNMIVRIIPKLNAHSDGFNSIGSQEKRINHNTNNFNQGNIIS